MRTFFFSALLFSYVSALGFLKDGDSCIDRTQCEEPLYCLNDGKGGGKCGKMPCGECRLGHICDEGKFCESMSCELSEECPGNLVCFSSLNICSYKSNKGQFCESNDQCWSAVCSDSKCDAPGAVTDDEKPVDGSTVADDAAEQPQEGIDAEDKPADGGDDEADPEATSDGEDESTVGADANGTDADADSAADDGSADQGAGASGSKRMGWWGILSIIIGSLLLFGLLAGCYWFIFIYRQREQQQI